MLRPEFGSDAGKCVIIVRALYGLKSAGASFRNHMADCMRHLGWMPCKADRNVWMKAKTRPSDRHMYFAYALLYVNDIFLVHQDAMTALINIDKYFKMKEESMGDPDFYLGAKLRKTSLTNGVEVWDMISSKYVNAAVVNAVSSLKSRGQEHMIPKRATTPFKGRY